MSHAIKDLVLRKIAQGLVKTSITSPARWAEKFRRMGSPFPGPWTFKYHPWLYEMHNNDYEVIVGQKAAQMGYTEWAMNMAFYYMDVHSMDVLYVLPTTKDASQFSASRFDPALELSPHLADFFPNVNNVSLKRGINAILYVRGSHSRSQLKSIPAPVMIFDEVDEMPKGTLALAGERQSGQVQTITLQLSTPTIDDAGINADFKLSTQNYYFFKCPSCNRFINLEYPLNLKITGDSLTDPELKNSFYFCNYCDNVLPTFEESTGAVLKPWLKHQHFGGTGRFVETYTDREIGGYHISQMYSMAKVGHPYRMAQAALKADRDPTYAQELHNSKLGITYVAEGAKVTDKMLNECLGGFHSGVPSDVSGIRTLGIDVGSVLHMVVKEYERNEIDIPAIGINDKYDAQVLTAETSSGSPRDFDEAYQLFHDYRVMGCVVDAEPERRMAMTFAQRIWGYVYLCDYLYSQMGREVQVLKDELWVKVNRTAWLDLTLNRYKNGTIRLPQDISKDFRSQIKEPTRVYKEDKWGQAYAVYVNVNDDHFAHADNYAEIALPVAASHAYNQDITELY